MRKISLASFVALAVAAVPSIAGAFVVVRAPVYVHPRPVVVVPAPVVVAPVPVYVAPAPQPVYVAPAAPQAPPPTAKLPNDTTMWTLPPGCLQVAVDGQTYFQCGPNWMKPLASDRGTYYAVVPPPK